MAWCGWLLWHEMDGWIDRRYRTERQTDRTGRAEPCKTRACLMLEWLDDGWTFIMFFCCFAGDRWFLLWLYSPSSKRFRSSRVCCARSVHGLCTVCDVRLHQAQPAEWARRPQEMTFFRPKCPSTAVYKGTVDKWSKEAVNNWIVVLVWQDPSRFFLSPQFLANWPDVWLNLDQLFKTLLSSVVSDQYWARALTCTDLH